MFTKDAIDALSLSKADAIRVANAQTPPDVLALPNDYTAHDMEKFGSGRRRARGGMTTSSAPSLAAYVARHAQPGSTVFVDANKMHAVAVLNIGTLDAPGHADDTATLVAETTAAHAALRKATLSAPLSQRDFAEWLEDWWTQIECEDQNECRLQVKHAVAAVRRVTIDAARKVETAEGQLSAERSAFESVKVRSDAGGLPALLRFTCEPYKGLSARTFDVRVRVRTGDKEPMFVLQVIRDEWHREQMAEEFSGIVHAVLGGSALVITGAYTRGT